MRRVFLSFLGTRQYMPCNYFYKDKKNNIVKNVHHIQKAILSIFCDNYTDNDKIYILATDKAREKNWKQYSEYSYDGLKKVLDCLDIKGRRELINIPTGNSENEIWETFQIIYEKLEAEDEIIFDITHGFRSMPMLVITLLNYTKFMKNINVRGIYYGAFESLGDIKDIRNLDIKKRNAPIFNLTAFSELQDWSVAADHFINSGNADKLTEAISKKTTSVFKFQEGDKEIGKKINELKGSMANVNNQLQTNRGFDIISGEDFIKSKNIIEDIKENYNDIKPLSYILENVTERLAEFKQNSIQNIFTSVKWCIDHNFIQQGITLLQEGIISYILEQLNIDKDEIESREVVSSYFWLLDQKNPPEDLNSRLQENTRLLSLLKESKLVNEIEPIFNHLRNFRNDINHAGFRKSRCSSSVKFFKAIEDNYKKMMEIIKEFE